MESKKILVIAGSRWQVPITKKIVQMGHKPYVVNLYKDSPAFSYAEEFGVMDILDKKACLDFAAKHRIDAVLSEQCDIAMPTVAYVAEKLGLPALNSSQAALYTNKYFMREFCRSHGFAFPEYKKCKDVHEALAFFHEMKSKIIIKPLDANSSRGVFVINSPEELEAHFSESLSFSKAEKCVLAERYIEGTEFTVDGIKTPNKHFSLAVSEKKHYPYNPNIARELYFSHNNSQFDYDSLKRQNDALVNLSGLKFGLTHAEYKYENGVFYLIEIAARGGGNLISSDIVPLMSGIDNYRYLVECALGNAKDVHFSIRQECLNTCAVLHFFDAPKESGVVAKINGQDFLKDNTDHYELNFDVGSSLMPASDDSKRIGFYIAHAGRKDKLDMLMNEIEKRFQIHLKRG